MFSIVAVPFDACRDLPAREFKTLVAVLRWVGRAGRCFPSLAQIADAVGVSEINRLSLDAVSGRRRRL